MSKNGSLRCAPAQIYNDGMIGNGVPSPTNGIVVQDNGPYVDRGGNPDSLYTATGWTVMNGHATWTYSNSFGQPENFMRWKPPLDQCGDWEVFAFIPWINNGIPDTSNAVYRISYRGGSANVTVDHSSYDHEGIPPDERWYSLGRFPFSANAHTAGESVLLGDNTGEGTIGNNQRSVNFDDMKWVFRGPHPACAAPVPTYTLSGRITQHDGSPLPGASVSDGAGRNAQTNSNGEYALSGIPQGSYSIAVVKDGYSFMPQPLTAGPQVNIPATTRLDYVAVLSPIVFIPGIMASYLKWQGGDELWPGIGRDHTVLTLNPPRAGIIAPDAIRTIDVAGPMNIIIYQPLLDRLTEPGRYREYAVAGDPARRTRNGCDTGQAGNHPNLFVFGYDWRQDNAQNAGLLAEYIGCIQRFYPNAKVNLLAHSMGGLVARRYILDHPSHAVAKVFTIGTPWLGSPKTIQIMETGDYGMMTPFVLQSGTLKNLVGYYPGAHQLLPSRLYQSLGGVPFKEEGWDINTNGQAYESYSYDQLVDFTNQRFASGNAGTANRDFHDRSGQDDWRADQSGIEYYHVYGIQPTAATIGTIKAVAEVNCILWKCWTDHSFRADMTKGDGTVSDLSASRWNAGVGYTAPNSHIHGYYSPDGDQVEHTKLVGNTGVQDSLFAFLQPAGLASQPARPSDAQDVLMAPACYVRASGISSLLAEDGYGNTTSSVSGTLTQPIPNLTYYNLGPRTSMLVAPTNQAYTLTLRGTNTPGSIEITQGTDTLTTKATRYLDVVLPASGNIQLNLQSACSAQLTIQGLDVPPTHSFEGAAAADTEAPQLTFVATAGMTGTLVTLQANDAQTGVQRIVYSVDGTNYQLYTKAFEVDVAHTPTISAFVEDRVGNRSSLYSHNLITVATPCCAAIHNGWYREPITVTLEPTDELPGPAKPQYRFANDAAWQDYTTPLSFNQEGVTQLLYRSIDDQGNVEAARSLSVRIDTRQPILDVAADQGIFTRLDTPSWRYTLSDPQPGSGIDTVEALPESPANLLWMDLGMHTVTITASDVAGWSVTDTGSFELIATLESLQGTVERLCTLGLIDNRGVCNALVQKIQAAIRKRDSGQLQVAAANVNAFINQVEAQTQKHIPTQAAALLVADAQYVTQHLTGEVMVSPLFGAHLHVARQGRINIAPLAEPTVVSLISETVNPAILPTSWRATTLMFSTRVISGVSDKLSLTVNIFAPAPEPTQPARLALWNRSHWSELHPRLWSNGSYTMPLDIRQKYVILSRQPTLYLPLVSR
jgi:pimeloyl-ACP methyl ester carboxylesterase